MRLVLILAAGLAACSPGDNQRVKDDARKAAADVKADAKKATKEIDKSLRETRDKVRKAVDAPPEHDGK